jgi:hypothetical protein
MKPLDQNQDSSARKSFERKLQGASRAHNNTVKRANLAFVQAVIQALLDLKGQSAPTRDLEAVANQILEAAEGNPSRLGKRQAADLKRVILESLTDCVEDEAGWLTPDEATIIASEIYRSLARQGRLG